MDRLSFVFSLLLIVSVTTTFGSVIKAKNPHGEEVEALLKRSHDAQAQLKGQKSSKDSEMSKRVPGSGDVIPGYELTPEKLEQFLHSLPSATRKVAIGIDNESTFKWEEPSTYFSFGTGIGELPCILHYEKAVLYGALSSESVLAETIGVLAYYIPDIDKTLAVMWSDPYKIRNKWNIGLFDGKREADSAIFRDLQNHARASDNVPLGSGLIATGEIPNDNSLITLEIHVRTAVERN